LSEPTGGSSEYTPNEDNAVLVAEGGGPIDGQTLTIRRPKGVLIVDRQSRRAWVYDVIDGKLVCRDGVGAELDDAGRFKAADDGNYDVLAANPSKEDVA
jgi:hypothetical protein